MPDWLWVLFIFLALTFGYFIGFTTGSYKNDADKPPTENAYIREAEINAAVRKDVEIRKAELEQQYAIERYKIAAAGVRSQNQTEQQNGQNESKQNV